MAEDLSGEKKNPGTVSKSTRQHLDGHNNLTAMVEVSRMIQACSPNMLFHMNQYKNRTEPNQVQNCARDVVNRSPVRGNPKNVVSKLKEEEEEVIALETT